MFITSLHPLVCKKSQIILRAPSIKPRNQLGRACIIYCHTYLGQLPSSPWCHYLLIAKAGPASSFTVKVRPRFDYPLILHLFQSIYIYPVCILFNLSFSTSIPYRQAKMTQLKMNGNGNGNSHTNGHSNGHAKHQDRTPPQVSFSETQISPSSFFGKLRKLYSEQVLKTQLDQLKNQGSYDAFKLEWHPAYEVRRLHGAKMRVSEFC